MLRSLCVYCSSSDAVDEGYFALARDLGGRLAARGTTLVYGGGRVGLMGAVADACLAGGGRAIGVIPEQVMIREAKHEGLTELLVVGSMHERKRAMFERADGFLALPGGFGTLEELLEVVTWKQLAMHARPVVVLNHGGYYDPLLEQIRRGFAGRFIPGRYEGIVHAAADLDAAFAYLDAYPPPAGPETEWV